MRVAPHTSGVRVIQCVLSVFVRDPGRNRTCDPLIKSQLLYQLSYGTIAFLYDIHRAIYSAPDIRYPAQKDATSFHRSAIGLRSTRTPSIRQRSKLMNPLAR